MRTCTCCGKEMKEGFVVGGGEEHYCSDECLHSKYTSEEWDEMSSNEDSDNYWTQWEDEDDGDNVIILE